MSAIVWVKSQRCTKVLSVVLALAVGLVFRLREDDGSILPRTLTVTVGVLDPDLDDM